MLLACPFFAQGEVVSAAGAKARAERFMRQARPARTPRLQLISDEGAMTKADRSAPEYFIFSDAGGGFVIAGGDDAVPAVLGYSLSGNIRMDGNLPANFDAWMGMWRAIVRKARAEGAPAYEPTPKRDGHRRELETASWNQGAPYNNFCFEIDGKHAVTGCTATAVAIVMRYHRWPDAGTGFLDGYSYGNSDKRYSVPGVRLGHTYAWDQMPLRYDATWTDEQITQVATLMRDVGVMLQSQYGTEGTGAYVNDIPAGLKKHMGYDGGTHYAQRFFYEQDEEWIALLEDNIDRVGPIVYGAHTDEDPPAGHAFVLDGYDENDNFHINWGWGGQNNGWYAMPRFDEYTQGHEAILGMKKDEGGHAPDCLVLYEEGISSSTTSFVTETSFSLSCKYVRNYGEEAFSGELAFAKFNRRDTIDELLSAPYEPKLATGCAVEFTEKDCVIRTPIVNGDYLRLVYRSDKTPDWTPVQALRDEPDAVSRIPLGKTTWPEDAVQLEYNAVTGLLTVTFREAISRELRSSNGTPVSAGVSDTGDVLTVDARELPPATYILSMRYKGQAHKLQIVFGLKK